MDGFSNGALWVHTLARHPQTADLFKAVVAMDGIDHAGNEDRLRWIEAPPKNQGPWILHMNEVFDRLEPFGQGNAEPLFLARGARLDEPPRRVGQDGAHLSLRLRDGTKVFKAIAFRMGPRADELRPGTPIHLAFRPVWNTFRGRTNLELQIADFQVDELELGP